MELFLKSSSSGILSEVKQWLVIQTKSKEELKVKNILKALHIQAFLPLMKASQFLFGNAVIRIEPLFPGYIFAHFNFYHKAELIRWKPGIRQILCFNGRPVAVQTDVIRYLKNQMTGSGIIDIRQRFKPNQKVRIAHGPLKDFEGLFVQELPGKERVRILLSVLSYSHKIELHPSLIEAI
jgi:transcriptional antiterminator RfaH